jgi:hypothetical protein
MNRCWRGRGRRGSWRALCGSVRSLSPRPTQPFRSPVRRALDDMFHCEESSKEVAMLALCCGKCDLEVPFQSALRLDPSTIFSQCPARVHESKPPLTALQGLLKTRPRT